MQDNTFEVVASGGDSGGPEPRRTDLILKLTSKNPSRWRLFGEKPKNINGNGVNMSGNGQGPKSGNVVGNGLRMVARGCQGSPELPTVLRF